MAYELRVSGVSKGTFDTEEAAVAAARDAVRADADADPEIFDTATGEPCAPGASRTWREELSRRVGF